jgi:outer membrane protein assembly factor BamD (BamD/ComL family)
MEIGRFYQRQGNWLAASTCFRIVKTVSDHQPHARALELVRLTRTSACPMRRTRQQQCWSQLPGSKWYKRAT